MHVEHGDLIDNQKGVELYLTALKESQKWLTVYSHDQMRQQIFKCSLLQINNEEGISMGPFVRPAVEHIMRRKNLMVQGVIAGHEVFFHANANSAKKNDMGNFINFDKPTKLYKFLRRKEDRHVIELNENTKPIMMLITSKDHGVIIARVQDISFSGAKILIFIPDATSLPMNETLSAVIDMPSLGDNRGQCNIKIKRVVNIQEKLWEIGCEICDMPGDLRRELAILISGDKKTYLRRIAHDITQSMIHCKPETYCLPGITAQDLLDITTDYLVEEATLEAS